VIREEFRKSTQRCGGALIGAELRWRHSVSDCTLAARFRVWGRTRFWSWGPRAGSETLALAGLWESGESIVEGEFQMDVEFVPRNAVHFAMVALIPRIVGPVPVLTMPSHREEPGATGLSLVMAP
jgi:hypothetical protein